MYVIPVDQNRTSRLHWGVKNRFILARSGCGINRAIQGRRGRDDQHNLTRNPLVPLRLVDVRDEPGLPLGVLHGEVATQAGDRAN